MVQWRAYCGTGAIAWPEFDRQRRVPARGRHTVKTPSTPNFRRSSHITSRRHIPLIQPCMTFQLQTRIAATVDA